MSLKTWSLPKSRSIGLFTDLSLFSEALELGFGTFITKELLLEDLSQRFKGLLFIKNQSSSGIDDLIRELRAFKWLDYCSNNSNSINPKYCLTEDGIKAFELYKLNKKGFLRLLTSKMHEAYTIPGWLVHRLFTINPKGQGEVVIPAPPRDWSPNSKKWEDNSWSNELEDQTNKSMKLIDQFFPGAFPIEEDAWINKVKNAWNRLSNLTQRRVAKFTGSKDQEKGRMEKYKPRRRLAMAMREAAVSHLFSNIPPNETKPDFSVDKDPLAPRTYMAWCPRLEALELIFYTDVHPFVPGRLLFPTSVFRGWSINDSKYEVIKTIKNPDGELLYLHQPIWESIKDLFLKILVQEHHRAYLRVGSLYVPLLDIRDEVCRQLRISANMFDSFIEKTIRETIRSELGISISVETDIREDQRSAHRLIRRPVWIEGVPHSLVAITEVEDTKRGIQ